MKKKKLVFLSLLTLFFACSKSQFTEVKPDTNSAKSDGCSNELTMAEIESIGELHNTYLQQAFEDFDFEAADFEAELRVQFLGLNVGTSPHLLSTSVKDSILDLAAVETDIGDFSQHFGNSSLVLTYYSNIEDAIESFEDIENLNNLLDDVQADVLANLECRDKELLLICIEVARNSAILWTPVELGGEAFLHEYFDLNSNLRAYPGYKKVIAADVAGLAGGFMRIGVLGMISSAFIPGTNAVLLGSLAFGAAWSSGIAAITP